MLWRALLVVRCGRYRVRVTIGPPPSRELVPPTPAPDGTLGDQLRAGAAPATRSRAWVWLLAGAGGFLAGEIIATVFAVVTGSIAGDHEGLATIAALREPPEWYIVSTLLGLWCGFFGGPWLASMTHGTRRLVADMGLRWRWIDLLGVPIGVAGQFLVALLYLPFEHHIAHFTQKFDAPSQKLTGGAHGVGFVVIAVLTVVGAPFFEELFFRGLLLRSFARLFDTTGSFVGAAGRWIGPAAAIVSTGVLFGLAHAESLQLLGLATFGVILSAISYWTGRLGMNMAAHSAFNLVAVIAIVAGGSGGTVLR